jgi:hypothetical protein
MSQFKKYAVFLSYATPNRELAQHINELFQDVKESVYYAPESLRNVPGSEQWRRHVIQGMKDSSTFVPIYTRQSIKRPWVLFESGAAEALGLKRFPVRTAGVSMEEIEPMGKDVTVYNLFEERSLKNLVINVKNAHRPHEDRSKIRDSVDRAMKKNSHKDAILRASKARWVFIAGNMPSKEMVSDELRWWESEDEFRNKLRNFVRDLTHSLLKAGFNLASCPQVPDVGQIVSTSYHDYQQKYPKETPHYRIGGLYPIDRYTRDHMDLDSEIQSQWELYLSEFKKSYLAGVEWLILIGGGTGTFREFNAACDLATKIVPVPFFGGTAYNLWKEIQEKSESPYAKWECGQSPQAASLIVEYMKGQ